MSEKCHFKYGKGSLMISTKNHKDIMCKIVVKNQDRQNIILKYCQIVINFQRNLDNNIVDYS